MASAASAVPAWWWSAHAVSAGEASVERRVAGVEHERRQPVELVAEVGRGPAVRAERAGAVEVHLGGVDRLREQPRPAVAGGQPRRVDAEGRERREAGAGRSLDG